MSARLPLARPRAAILAVTLLASAPALARACSVCGGGNPANRFAFFASTIALSLLPLGMFVGAFLWLRAKLRGRDEFMDRDAPPPGPHEVRGEATPGAPRP